jgi:F0F1-type ATP synthase assembly protein I
MKQNDRQYYLLAMKIVLDFGATIAVPAIIFTLIGQYLDEKYGKYPLFVVLCLINAFLITAKIVITKAKAYGKIYQNIDQAKQD